MTTSKSRLLSATTAAALLLASPAAAETLVVSWWGFNGDKLNEFIVQPFQEQCECELVFETGNNADRLNRVQIRGGAGVDVIYLSDSFAQIGVEAGLFQPIDRSLVPNIDGLYEMAQNPHGEFGPAYTIGRVGIVYDAERVTAPITQWEDLWRDDLANALSLPGITTTAGPMVVMIAGEKAGTDAFEDADPAFAEIEALRSNVVTNYNTGSEMINLFSTGEISVSLAQDFALGQLQQAVPSIVWAELEDGDIATLNTVNIPTGAANVELAHEFINFILDPERQALLARNGVDAPVATAVDLTEEEAAQWTYGDGMIAGLQRIDYTQMNAAKTAWIDRWNEVFGM
ncbi:ABC transporter substrate-binding protein [Roseicitreum antarcticum]|uniref:Putative spermidine/putrescine transport system substrate-binding protein n=1 Tax=Roseicitreum antarcticum TaxID=564137 RepID=A0A1H2TPD3_9RHOB|nr:ABC transporter substrate-binding protein [Roseicitreum antarcticum]SDW45740.1 putative spermidine/putrescine transport system substrate-binding protein [Roseicitreum antarcticum]